MGLKRNWSCECRLLKGLLLDVFWLDCFLQLSFFRAEVKEEFGVVSAEILSESNGVRRGTTGEQCKRTIVDSDRLKKRVEHSDDIADRDRLKKRVAEVLMRPKMGLKKSTKNKSRLKGFL